MATKKIRPSLVYADTQGNIYDNPELEMLCSHGATLELPRPGEIIPLPEGSDIFMLPNRRPLGLDPSTGRVEPVDGYAVAAFVSPGYTLSATVAYAAEGEGCRLPLFAYGALGFANGRFYVCAKRVDSDQRQVFTNIPHQRIQRGARSWLERYPHNRLVRHLSKCALTSCCPAARNLALGRFEAPLPTARGCNARCVGCISLQPPDSGFPATQNRIEFRPEPQEILQIMRGHAERERRPIFSFGQGCEGEPLLEAPLLEKTIAAYRAENGVGTVNVNTNGSLPHTMAPLAEAGFSSIRVSLNSVRPKLYNAYYRPAGYTFDDVLQTLAQAKANKLFVSLNYLYFPGVNDTEEELAPLLDLLTDTKPDFIQLRNLNLDPRLYLDLVPEPGPGMGLTNFMKRIRKAAPWIRFGYFNPYLEQESARS
ncbi:MAG: radical SAM protein [Desulfovibrionales bacterium]